MHWTEGHGPHHQAAQGLHHQSGSDQGLRHPSGRTVAIVPHMPGSSREERQTAMQRAMYLQNLMQLLSPMAGSIRHHLIGKRRQDHWAEKLRAMWRAMQLQRPRMADGRSHGIDKYHQADRHKSSSLVARPNHWARLLAWPTISLALDHRSSCQVAQLPRRLRILMRPCGSQAPEPQLSGRKARPLQQWLTEGNLLRLAKLTTKMVPLTASGLEHVAWRPAIPPVQGASASMAWLPKVRRQMEAAPCHLIGPCLQEEHMLEKLRPHVRRLLEAAVAVPMR